MELDIAKKKALALATAKLKLKKVNQQSSMTELAAGPQPIKRGETKFGVSGSRTQKAQKADPMAFYQKHLPSALMVGEDEVDLTGGAPIGLRAGYDFLPTMSDKAEALRNKFGEENVKALNVSGNPTLLYRDKNKWKFFDLPFGVEFADVTADLAGDVAPTVASVAAALPASVTSPIGMAAAGGAANMAVGSAQDYAARKYFGIEANKAEIAKRRGMESVLGIGLDWGLMKGSSAIANGVLGQKGVDVAAQQLKAIEDKINLPSIVQTDKGIEKVIDASKVYKDGTAAKFLAGVRDQINWEFTGETIDAEPIIKKFTAEHVNKLLGELDSLNKSVSNVVDERVKKEASMPNMKLATDKAKKEAQEVFNSIYKKESKKVAVKDLSPAELGKKVQSEIANNNIKVGLEYNAKRQLKDELLKDQTFGAFELRRIFNKNSRSVMRDSEDEIISILASPSQKMSNAVGIKLDDIMDQDFTFKQLEDLVRSVSDKAGDGSTANKGAYTKLANDLREFRGDVLKRSSEEAQNAFNDANNYFQDVVLKYREGSVGSAIKTEKGEHWTQAIENVAKGGKPVFPSFTADPGEVIKRAIKNPTEIENTLRATGNSLDVRNAMRTEFLASKGIVKDTPIPKKSFDFTREQRDVIDALWPKTESGGINRKYQTLKKLQKLSEGEGEFIESMTSETINKLTSQNTEVVEKEILKLVKEESLLNKKKNKLASNYLIKLWNKGRVPLPENQTIMETFITGIRRAEPIDQSAFLKLLKESGKDEEFSSAVINDLVKRVQKVSSDPDIGSSGQVMWDYGKMQKELSSKEEYLKRFIGKDKYDNLVKWNNALKWTSNKGKETAGTIRIGATKGTGEGAEPNFYMSNIHIPIANRFKSAIIAAQLKSPVPTKVLMNKESHDKWMERIIKWTFIADQGVEALMRESEADPAFKEWTTGFYKEALSQQ